MLIRTTLALIIVACGTSTDAKGTPSGGSVHAPAPAARVSEVARASTILTAQLAAIRNGNDPDLVASFSSAAIVLVPDPRAAHGETTGCAKPSRGSARTPR